MRLDFITRGNGNIRGKANIYFCGHPADYDSVYEEVVEDILEMPDCVIWHDAEPEDDWEEEQYISRLSEMQLFVIPITRHFLYEENRAFSKELPFAIKNHIPVLPLMEDSGLDHIFEEKCGNLQSLKKQVKGPDAVPYKERLKKYLHRVLIGNEWLEKIPQVFEGEIFLAYRKDDRNYAHQFMQAVHEDVRFRSIGIWYDEFLETGYDFSEEIQRAIKSSHMFAMVVTPNILTNGAYNYVKEQEYPLAASLGKPVLPVEFVQTDHAKLKTEYKGIPVPVCSHDKGGFCRALESVFSGDGSARTRKDPEDQFLLGLAYLGGVGLERNTKYAVPLITSAAEAGLSQAIERLVTMYEYGEAVERNLSAAIGWQEQLVRCRREEYERTGLREGGIRTVFEQHRLYGYLTEAGREQEALGISIQMKKLSSELRKKHPRDYSSIECLVISLSDVADALYRLGDVKEAEKIRLSLGLLNKLLAHDVGLPDADEDLSINYQHLGGISEEKNDFKTALKYYQKSLQISEKMKENNGTDAIYRRWLNDLYRVGRCYLELGRTEDAESYLQKCLKGHQSFSTAADSNLWNVYFALSSVSCQKFELKQALHCCEACLQLAEYEEGIEGQRRLADSYARKADVLKAEKHYKDAESCYRKVLELSERIFKETGEAEDQDRLWRTYGMLGDCYLENRRIEEAKRYYQKSLHEITRLSEWNSTWQNRLGLAQGYQRMGMATYREGGPVLARIYFEKAFAIVKKAEREHPDPRVRWMKKLLKEQMKACRGMR